ncbi:unnamed protein product [Lymnaea stagnalis]|uniref:Fucolectin tachylectin-4 pentraxin-1 domain-containing protein n=1 Tax=Lymnaea stagnalis TaxID=6523 RepID=A0AAV2IJQ9_LYMST
MNFISTLIFFTLCWFLVKCSSSCQAGWFGSRCQFECHCAPDCKVTSGECLAGSKCQRGWFGRACQYQDLAAIKSAAITADIHLTSPNWITDRDDSTCNGDVNLESIVVTWNDTTPFTWLRFAVNVSSDLVNVSVTFKASATGMTEMACNNQQIFLVDNHTMDVRCNVTVGVMQVIIRGQSVKSLCSLYISGGRNVALKQSASQTSTYVKDKRINIQASSAIDGKTDGNLFSETCSHTADGDLSPSWNVKFDRPQAVDRFVLYNRFFNDCLPFPCADRLKHFILQSVDSNNNTILNYQDATETALSVYTVTVPGHLRALPVSGVHMNATVKVNSDPNPVLTICEFEAYGECAPGTWGLECNNQCNSSCNTTCHAETGACPVCIGFSNPQCDAQMTEDTTAIGVVVGVSVGCLLIVSILVAIYCWKRRGRSATETAATRPHQTQNIKNINFLSHAEDDHEYETVGTMGSSEEIRTNTSNKYDSEKENCKGAFAPPPPELAGFIKIAIDCGASRKK